MAPAGPADQRRDALQCTVVTPERTVLEMTAQFVALPLFDGEIGIAPRHRPLIGRLGFGEMRVRDDTGTHGYYVDGGFVEIIDNRVTVLTGRAQPAAELDPEEAAERLAAARSQPAHGTDALTIRDRQVARARGQLRVARRAQAAGT